MYDQHVFFSPERKFALRPAGFKVSNLLSSQAALSESSGVQVKVVDALSRRIPLVSDRPTIILGADVTHPRPGEDSSPSIAAVVASQDWPEITKYASLVCAQAHRQELIQDLFKQWQDPVRGTVTSGMIKYSFSLHSLVCGLGARILCLLSILSKKNWG